MRFDELVDSGGMGFRLAAGGGEYIRGGEAICGSGR